ncbi:hypothetical protein MMC30_003384 [Trapelia coarctata]|nr:hypothetical protein [Trapelia coarctata]
MSSSSDYHCDLTHFPGYAGAGSYIYEAASTDSSPSPVSLFSHLDPTGYESYPDASHNYQTYNVTTGGPLVEFTDLTAPYNEDRRRRRPQAVKDKQTISSMHMRRRAQNRASQRAFRDRKEKHAQNLQNQLDELEAKHQELSSSYRKLETTNSKLVTELEELRAKITTLTSSRDTLDEMMTSELFDPYDFDHGQQADSKLTGHC